MIQICQLPATHMRVISVFVLICTFGLFAGNDAKSQESADPDLTFATEQIDSVFKNWDSKHTPGCAVEVNKDGRKIFDRAYGMADLEHLIPNTPSTIFEAGSVSKQFVSAAIVLLKLEGKLSLEDDVRDYIPEVPDFDETITIRHLLTHTSGLRDWGSVAAISGWGRGVRTHNHDHVLDIISRQTRLNFDPGEYYSYSNSGYNLAVMIVDEVSDTTFTGFTDQNIFKPLGMNNTEWRDDYTRIVEGRSSAYTAESDSFSINRPIEHVHGNGGLLTTAGDLNIWNEAMHTGRLAGDEFVEIMHEMGVLNNGRTNNYALGVREGTHLGLPFISHTGATSGYRAFLRRYPDQHTSVAILCNVTNANPGSLGNQVSEIFLEDHAIEEEEEDPVGIELTTSELDRRTGIYKNPLNGSATVLKMENDTLQTDDDQVLTPKTSNEFRVGTTERHFIFQENGNIKITVEGYPEGELHKVEEFAPSRDELEEFTGEYYSEDAETRLKIKLKDDKIEIHRRPNDTFEVKPIYMDAFTGGFGKLRFIRNENGEIEQLSLGRGRVYDMRFIRSKD